MDTNAHRKHVAVWLDHHEARILDVGADSFEESTLREGGRHVRRHPDRNAAEAKHPDDTKRYFEALAGALASADEILVTGPSTAKLHFLKFAHEHQPHLAARIVGVETVDHPTDPQLAAHARRYFHGVDRMRGLVP